MKFAQKGPAERPRAGRKTTVYPVTVLMVWLATSPWAAGSARDQCPAEWSGGLPAVNSNVNALNVYNGELVAAGEFGKIDAQDVSRIVKWNGTSMVPAGHGD